MNITYISFGKNKRLRKSNDTIETPEKKGMEGADDMFGSEVADGMVPA